MAREHQLDLSGHHVLRRVERSTDQVMQPVNTDALDKWVGHIPADVLRDMADIAPMLQRLGYDPRANPPDYRRERTAIASLFNYSQVSSNILADHSEEVDQKHRPEMTNPILC